jgi:hypothetical protein
VGWVNVAVLAHRASSGKLGTHVEHLERGGGVGRVLGASRRTCVHVCACVGQQKPVKNHRTKRCERFKKINNQPNQAYPASNWVSRVSASARHVHYYTPVVGVETHQWFQVVCTRMHQHEVETKSNEQKQVGQAQHSIPIPSRSHTQPILVIWCCVVSV